MTRDTHAPAQQHRLLSFQLGADEYAVDLAHVREIVRYETVTRVPRMPACVKGVVNLRGSVVPVVDLALGLGLAPADVTPQACLVVLEMLQGGERATLGLLVDAVSRVLELGPDELDAVPSFGTRVPAGFLLAMARVEGGSLPLLDLERLLASGALVRGVAHGAGATDAPVREAGETS